MDEFGGYADAGPAAAPAGPLRLTVRPSTMTPGPPGGAADDAFSDFVDIGPDANPRPPVSRGRAAFEGALDTAGFGFRDEVLAASKASGLPEIFGGLRAPFGLARMADEIRHGQIGFGGVYFGGRDKVSPGGTTGLISGDTRGPAHRIYDEELAAIRQLQRDAEEQNPKTYLAGQLGGAIVAPGLGATARAATAGARAARSAIAGGISGGLYGYGSGEGTEDRVARAATGTVIGGAAGGVLSPVIDAGVWGLGKVGHTIKGVYDSIRAELRPGVVEDEAARRIMSAATADVVANKGRPIWSPGENAVAAEAGIPRSVVDTGGENTMALARASANLSPEARHDLTELASDRFSGQATRAAKFLTSMTGTKGGAAVETLEQLKSRAAALNAPRYARAYRAGDRPIWSDEIERLAAAPGVQQAMRSAVTSGQDRAIEGGFGAFNPGVTVTPDGRILMGQTMRGGAVRGTPTYPNLQYWDYVQRDLADLVEKVQGREPDKARYLNSLHQQLNSELDRLVPQFEQARVGAWREFQAQDALEAGRNFVHARAENADYVKSLAGFNSAERELFAHGFASELIDRVRELGDRQDIFKQAFLGAKGGGSQAARERINMALGKERADKLEVYLRAESLADRLRTALGNSTTARQLAEMGLATAGAGVIGHGLSTDEVDKGHLIGAALLLGSAYGKHRAQVFEKSLATRIGTMLASDDPAIMRRGAEIVAKSERLMGALRTAGDVLGKKLNRGLTARVVAERPLQGGYDFLAGP